MSKFNKGEFTVVPSKSAREGLKPVLQTVYTWLCDFGDENLESYPSRPALANKCGISVDTLDKAVKDLIDMGMIEKKERYVNNEQTTNIYQAKIVEKAVGNLRPPSRKNPTQNSTQLTQPITSTNVEGTSSSLLAPIPKKSFGNPDVNEVIQMFEKTLDIKLSRVVNQRRAASTLIKRYGKDYVLQGIVAAANCSDDQYAPHISSVEDLQEKWNKLVIYYRKKKKTNKSNVVDLDGLEE